jgi:hypothetical protein
LQVQDFIYQTSLKLQSIAAECGTAEGLVMAYLTLPRRIATLLTMSTVIVSCSLDDGLMPPADVDGTARVGSISSNAAIARQQNHQQPMQPMPPMQTIPDVSPSMAGSQQFETYEQQYGAPPTTLNAQHQQLSDGADSQASAMSSAEGEGINIDNMVGAGQPVVGLAQEQDGQIAEAGTHQPVIGNIGSDEPSSLNHRVYSASTYGYPQAREPQMPREPVREPVREVAMLRPQSPVREPNISLAPNVMPQSEVACRGELRRLGVGFKDVPRISNGNSCGIAYPIELSGLSGGVTIKPSVKLNCQVTLAFAKWVKFELNPSARFRYLSGVGRITPMGGYSCRKMNSRSSNPWSEHARGNAIDIGKITLKNGNSIDVRKKSIFSFREKGLLKAVRTDSCKYFSTVLGPGSDPQHWNHFHFDLRTRKSGYRHCD